MGCFEMTRLESDMFTSESVSDCTFCSVVNSDLVFARSRLFVAIYNISPVVDGHSLIIPSRHLESVLDLNDDYLFDMIRLVRDTTDLLSRAYTTDAFDWALQNGAVAGQSQRHLHFHILPRKEGDLTSADAWLKEIPGFLEGIDGQERRRLSVDEQTKIARWLQGFRKG